MKNPTKKKKFEIKQVKTFEELRKIIDQQWGKKAFPWPISKQEWFDKQIKEGPIKIAFKDGKLFAATCAMGNGKWFDRTNKPVEVEE